MTTTTTTKAMSLKDRGNELLAAGDVPGALAAYSQGLASLEPRESPTALYLNSALALARLEQHDRAVDMCTKALDSDPGNAKALYRRAKSRIALNLLELAAVDARTLLQVNPKSQAGGELLRELAKTVRQMDQGARKLLSEACASGASRDLMRQLIGMVHEDEARGAEIAGRGGAGLLLAHALDKDSLGFVLLSRLSGIQGAAQAQVTQSLDESGAQARVVAKVFDEALEEGHSAAALALLMRTQVGRDKQASDAKRAVPELDCGVYLDALATDRVKVREVAIEACAGLFGMHEARALRFVQAGGVEALKKVAKNEPQLAAVVLGRVLPRALGHTKDNDEVVFQHVQRLCADGLDLRRSGSGDAEDMAVVRGGLNALLSVMQANGDMGLEVVNQSADTRQALAEAALRAPDATASIAVEIMAQMASSEKGRSALQEPNLNAALHKLVGHSNAAIRASASVALTKMEATHFDGNSEQGMLVLGSVGGLLREGASQDEIKRGIEAVSFVIADTDVKMMLCTGDGFRIVQDLCRAARAVKPLHQDPAQQPQQSRANPPAKPAAASAADSGKAADADAMSNETAYALAYVLSNLTMDEDDKKREKLREMEVTQEQWEKFEEMTKQKSRPGNSRKDSAEEVALRVDAVVSAGGVPALRNLLATRGSSRVGAAAAKTLANMAREQRLRGKMLSEGAVGALLRAYKLCMEDEAKPDKQGGRDAAHALARLLITTDPRLLAFNHIMDAISPLVAQVKNCDEDLVVFECCMALTNLASVGEEAKHKIVAMQAVGALEFAQFSDTPLVRRAATEALANLVPEEGLVRHLAQGDKIRLWLLLAEDFDTDFETARAASGALANLALDPRTAAAMRRFGAVDRLAELCLPANCAFPEISHRAAVALVGLQECEWVGDEQAKQDVEADSGGAKVTQEPAQRKWQGEQGAWTIREGEVALRVLRAMAALKIVDQAFVPAQTVAQQWLAGR